MEKSTKTVVIDKRLLYSLPLGIIVAVLVIFSLHYFGTWKLRPDSFTFDFQTGNDRLVTVKAIDNLSMWDIDDGSWHYVPFDLPIKVYEGESRLNENKFSNSWSHAFDGHLKHFLIFSLIATTVVYLLQRIRFKVA